MHHGIYKGIAADKSAKRILILGESHHGKDEEKGIPALYTTQEVVETYLSEKVTKRNLEIFHKIAQSFGVDTTKEEEKLKFWDKVYFGNYVDEVCGIGTNDAKYVIEKNKDTYNQELAEFVNREKIEYIFCFSVLVYKNLPNKYAEEEEVVSERKKRVFLRRGTYEPGDFFDHSVTVYGIPHPSAQGGFYPQDFVKECEGLVNEA